MPITPYGYLGTPAIGQPGRGYAVSRNEWLKLAREIKADTAHHTRRTGRVIRALVLDARYAHHRYLAAKGGRA
jgi:hypothetical protein